MKILLAVDGSPCSDEAVLDVARRCWPEGSEIKVLSVAEPVIPMWGDGMAVSTMYSPELDKTLEAAARRNIELAVTELKRGLGGHVTITSAFMEATAKEAILSEAEDWGADLIVVGSHGYRGLTRFLLGSVSQAVATHAKCSVEIVRSRRPVEATGPEKKT